MADSHSRCGHLQERYTINQPAVKSHSKTFIRDHEHLKCVLGAPSECWFDEMTGQRLKERRSAVVTSLSVTDSPLSTPRISQLLQHNLQVGSTPERSGVLHSSPGVPDNLPSHLLSSPAPHHGWERPLLGLSPSPITKLSQEGGRTPEGLLSVRQDDSGIVWTDSLFTPPRDTSESSLDETVDHGHKEKDLVRVLFSPGRQDASGDSVVLLDSTTEDSPSHHHSMTTSDVRSPGHCNGPPHDSHRLKHSDSTSLLKLTLHKSHKHSTAEGSPATARQSTAGSSAQCSPNKQTTVEKFSAGQNQLLQSSTTSTISTKVNQPDSQSSMLDSSKRRLSAGVDESNTLTTLPVCSQGGDRASLSSSQEMETQWMERQSGGRQRFIQRLQQRKDSFQALKAQVKWKRQRGSASSIESLDLSPECGTFSGDIEGSQSPTFSYKARKRVAIKGREADSSVESILSEVFDSPDSEHKKKPAPSRKRKSLELDEGFQCNKNSHSNKNLDLSSSSNINSAGSVAGEHFTDASLSFVRDRLTAQFHTSTPKSSATSGKQSILLSGRKEQKCRSSSVKKVSFCEIVTEHDCVTEKKSLLKGRNESDSLRKKRLIKKVKFDDMTGTVNDSCNSSTDKTSKQVQTANNSQRTFNLVQTAETRSDSETVDADLKRNVHDIDDKLESEQLSASKNRNQEFQYKAPEKEMHNNTDTVIEPEDAGNEPAAVAVDTLDMFSQISPSAVEKMCTAAEKKTTEGRSEIKKREGTSSRTLDNVSAVSSGTCALKVSSKKRRFLYPAVSNTIGSVDSVFEYRLSQEDVSRRKSLVTAVARHDIVTTERHENSYTETGDQSSLESRKENNVNEKAVVDHCLKPNVNTTSSKAVEGHLAEKIKYDHDKKLGVEHSINSMSRESANAKTWTAEPLDVSERDTVVTETKLSDNTECLLQDNMARDSPCNQIPVQSTAFTGFQCAAGKSFSLSLEALSKAKQLFDEDPTMKSLQNTTASVTPSKVINNLSVNKHSQNVADSKSDTLHDQHSLNKVCSSLVDDHTGEAGSRPDRIIEGNKDSNDGGGVRTSRAVEEAEMFSEIPEMYGDLDDELLMIDADENEFTQMIDDVKQSESKIDCIKTENNKIVTRKPKDYVNHLGDKVTEAIPHKTQTDLNIGDEENHDALPCLPIEETLRLSDIEGSNFQGFSTAAGKLIKCNDSAWKNAKSIFYENEEHPVSSLYDQPANTETLVNGYTSPATNVSHSVPCVSNAKEEVSTKNSLKQNNSTSTVQKHDELDQNSLSAEVKYERKCEVKTSLIDEFRQQLNNSCTESDWSLMNEVNFLKSLKTEKAQKSDYKENKPAVQINKATGLKHMPPTVQVNKANSLNPNITTMQFNKASVSKEKGTLEKKSSLSSANVPQGFRPFKPPKISRPTQSADRQSCRYPESKLKDWNHTDTDQSNDKDVKFSRNIKNNKHTSNNMPETKPVKMFHSESDLESSNTNMSTGDMGNEGQFKNSNKLAGDTIMKLNKIVETTHMTGDSDLSAAELGAMFSDEIGFSQKMPGTRDGMGLEAFSVVKDNGQPVRQDSLSVASDIERSSGQTPAMQAVTSTPQALGNPQSMSMSGSEMPVGFSTASGKALALSTKAILKAESLLAGTADGDSCSLDKMVQEDKKSCDPVTSDLHDEAFKIKRKKLTSKHNFQPSNGETFLENSLRRSLPPSASGGFSTASGKAVTVSKMALMTAAKVLDDISTNTDKYEDSSVLETLHAQGNSSHVLPGVATVREDLESSREWEESPIDTDSDYSKMDSHVTNDRTAGGSRNRDVITTQAMDQASSMDRAKNGSKTVVDDSQNKVDGCASKLSTSSVQCHKGVAVLACKPEQTTSDSRSCFTPSFQGFNTASGKTVSVSDKYLGRAKAVLEDARDVQSPQEQQEALILMNEDKDKTCTKTVDILDTCASAVPKSVNADHQCPLFDGFRTGAGKLVHVSDRALELAKQTLNQQSNETMQTDACDEDVFNIPDMNTVSCLETCENKNQTSVNRVISRQEYERVDRSVKRDFDMPKGHMPSFCGFITAAGKKVDVTKEAYKHARGVFDEQETDLQYDTDASLQTAPSVTSSDKSAECTAASHIKTSSAKSDTQSGKSPLINTPNSFEGFCTASGNEVSVSSKAEDKASNLFNDKDSGGKAVGHNLFNEDESEAKLDDHADTLNKVQGQDICMKRGFRGFSTASGKDVTISEEALMHARTTLHTDNSVGESRHNIPQRILKPNMSEMCDRSTTTKVESAFNDQEIIPDCESGNISSSCIKEIPPRLDGFSTAREKRVKNVSETVVKHDQSILNVDELDIKVGCDGRCQKPVSKIVMHMGVSELSPSGSLIIGQHKYNKLGKKTGDIVTAVEAISKKPTFDGFSTASENKVTISHKALAHVRNIFNEDMDEQFVVPENINQEEFSDLKMSTENIATVSGKDITHVRSVSNEGMKKTSVNKDGMVQENFPGFSTASGNKISISEKALEHVRSTLATDDPDPGFQGARARKPEFSGFTTASGTKVDVSDSALNLARKTLDKEDKTVVSLKLDNTTAQLRQFPGFITASGRNVAISDSALKHVRCMFESVDESGEPVPSAAGAAFHTAAYRLTSLSKGALEHVQETLPIETGRFTGGLHTSIRSDVQQKQGKQTDSTKTNKEKVNNDEFPENRGFMTASGKPANVSERALEHVKTLLDEERSVQDVPSFSGFSTASCTSAHVPDKAIEHVNTQPDEESRVQNVPAFSGFSTASGKTAHVSEKALQHVKGMFEEQDVQVMPAFSGFSTASGKTAHVSEKALQHVKGLFEDDVQSIPAFVRFSTASGKRTPISEKALQHVKGLSDESSDNSSGFSGFSTASGCKVTVSDQALLQEKATLDKSDDLLACKDKVPKTDAMSIQTGDHKGRKSTTKESSLDRRSPVDHHQGGSSREELKGSPIKRQKIDDTSEKKHFLSDRYNTDSRRKPMRCGPESTTDRRHPGFRPFKPVRSKFPSSTTNRCLDVAPPAVSPTVAVASESRSTFQTPYKLTPSGTCAQGRTQQKHAVHTKTPVFLPKSVLNKSIASQQEAQIFDKTIQKRTAAGSETIEDKKCDEIDASAVSNVGIYVNTKTNHVRLQSNSFVERTLPNSVPIDKNNVKNKINITDMNENDASIIVKAKATVSMDTNNINIDTMPVTKAVSSVAMELTPVAKAVTAVKAVTPVAKAVTPVAMEVTPVAMDTGELDEFSQDSEGGVFFCLLVEARLRQEEMITRHRHTRVEPVAGRLWEMKHGGSNIARWRLADVIDGAGKLDGVCRFITSATAGDFKFRLSDYYSGASSEVLVGDGAFLVPDDSGHAGTREFYKALLTVPGVDGGLVSEAWVTNHYRWIVWKLAAYQLTSSQLANRCLCPEMVMLQLKYRYDREIDRAERSCIKKIYERDDTPGKRLVLCVAEVRHLSQDGSVIDSPSTARDSKIQLFVTDGWYGIPAQLDDPLSDLVHAGKIRVGLKLVTTGAELVGGTDACTPLEAPADVMMKLSYNSTRPAPWDCRLGYQPDPRPLCLPLTCLHGNGGTVGVLDVIIVRKYPLMYLEKTAGGERVFRTAGCEDRARAQHEAVKQEQMEKLYRQLADTMDQEQRKQRRRSHGGQKVTRTTIEHLQTGQEIYEAMESSCQPDTVQGYLSDSQLQLLYEHRREVEDQRRHELQSRVQAAWQEKLETFPDRQVSPVLKLRLAGCATRDVDSKASCLLTVWRPAAEICELEEGHRYKIYSLNTAPARSQFSGCSVQLTATKQTRYRKMTVDENFLDSLYEPREVLLVSEISTGQAAYGELDFVGLVVKMIPASYSGSDVVYLSDSDGGLLAVRLWNATRSYSREVFTVGATLCCSNLQVRGSSQGAQPVTADVVTELSALSNRPHTAQQRRAVDKLNTATKCNKQFLTDAQEKLERILSPRYNKGHDSVQVQEIEEFNRVMDEIMAKAADECDMIGHNYAATNKTSVVTETSSISTSSCVLESKLTTGPDASVNKTEFSLRKDNLDIDKSGDGKTSLDKGPDGNDENNREHDIRTERGSIVECATTPSCKESIPNIPSSNCLTPVTQVCSKPQSLETTDGNDKFAAKQTTGSSTIGESPESFTTDRTPCTTPTETPRKGKSTECPKTLTTDRTHSTTPTETSRKGKSTECPKTLTTERTSCTTPMETPRRRKSTESRMARLMSYGTPSVLSPLNTPTPRSINKKFKPPAMKKAAD